jgi:hypothetical protein
VQDQKEIMYDEIKDDIDPERPKNRQECINGKRPCPWIMCGWHTIWVRWPVFYRRAMHGSENPFGVISDDQIIQYLESSPYTCILDACEAAQTGRESMGNMSLDELGAILETSRERIRQIIDYQKLHVNGNFYEMKGALAKLRQPKRLRMLLAFRDMDGGDPEELTLHKWR